MKSNPSLYISDLDGTLLDSSAELRKECRENLVTMLREGLPFTIASARSVTSMQMMLGDLPLPLPVIEFNGAFLSDLTTGRHEVINHIETGVVEEIYQIILDHNLVPFLSTFNGREDRAYYCDIINEGMEWYLHDRLSKGDRRWRKIESLPSAFADQMICLTVIGREDMLSELSQALWQSYSEQVEIHFQENFYSPGWHWLTVHDRRATKDQGIQILRERWDLGRSELVVFGDHVNDLKMFLSADRSIAVSNARDEVKACATEIIGSNDEGSVVKYIRREWSEREELNPLPGT